MTTSHEPISMQTLSTRLDQVEKMCVALLTAWDATTGAFIAHLVKGGTMSKADAKSVLETIEEVVDKASQADPFSLEFAVRLATMQQIVALLRTKDRE